MQNENDINDEIYCNNQLFFSRGTEKIGPEFLLSCFVTNRAGTFGNDSTVSSSP